MALIDQEFLSSLGIVLDDQSFQSFDEHFQSTLRERILTEIVAELTPAQAEELATMENASDPELQQWLAANIPDLQEIVSDEIDILLGEVAESAEQL